MSGDCLFLPVLKSIASCVVPYLIDAHGEHHTDAARKTSDDNPFQVTRFSAIVARQTSGTENKGLKTFFQDRQRYGIPFGRSREARYRPVRFRSLPNANTAVWIVSALSVR